MIFWEDTITIITILFEIKDKDVAEQLGVSASLLSKVKKSKKEPTIEFIPTAIYRKIFDPSMRGTPAFTRKKELDVRKAEKDILFDLRNIILSFQNVREALDDYWDINDYKTFVMKLLERTKRNPLVESKPKRTVVRAKSVSISEVSIDKPSANGTLKADSTQGKYATSSSQVSDSRNKILCPEDVNMPDDFFDGIKRYKIADFFELNLMDWIETNSMFGQRKPDIIALVQSATEFVMHMDTAIKLTESTEENAHILREIDSYINNLRKYIDFLQKSVADPLRFVAGAYADQKAIDEAIAEFERKAAEYRADLRSQYKKIDDCIDHSIDQFKMYDIFDGLKYRLKKQ